jgi:hypothetical protein
LDKPLSDGVAASEAAVNEALKALADGAVGTDSAYKDIYKLLFEPADAYGLGVYGFSHYGGSGALQVADATAKAMSKPIADGVAAAEAIAKHFMMAFADGASAADAVLKAIDKAISDGVEIDDSDFDVLMLMILTLMQRTTTLHVQERP